MDGLEFNLDTSKFERALVEYMKYSKRTIPEVVNKSAVDVIIKAAQYTKKATPQKIEQIYSTQQILVSSTGKALKKPRNVIVPSRLVYRIINARRKKKGLAAIAGKEMGDAAQKLIKSRLHSIGYIAYAGWQKALIALGGRGFGSRGKLNPKSYAAQGGGTKAEWMRPAVFSNTARGASKVGFSALRRALNERVQDMLGEVARRMERAAKG